MSKETRNPLAVLGTTTSVSIPTVGNPFAKSASERQQLKKMKKTCAKPIGKRLNNFKSLGYV